MKCSATAPCCRARILSILLAAIFAAVCISAFALNAVWPQSSDEGVLSDGSFRVETGNSEKGYIIASGPECEKKLKLRIEKDDTTLTYDLNLKGNSEVFPLQLGSGKYTVTLYKQTSGKKYSQEGRVSFKVNLEREDAAYLCPNQYVNYNESTPAVAKSDEVCAGLATQAEKFNAISDYIDKNFVYDFVTALTVAGGSLPDIDRCWEKGMGICQDLSALTACMLRVQGIPARLVIGYVDDGSYHAWVEADVDGVKQFYDPTAVSLGLGGDSVYVEERSY